MRGRDVIAETLMACGVDYSYGVAGSVVLGTLDSISQTDIEFVPCRDEQFATTAATSQAMATRRPVASIAHVGPGAANLILSVGAAYRENVPLVVLTGNEPSTRLGRNVRHEWDVMEIFERFTKYNVQLTRDRMHEKLRDAVIQSVTGTPGPVHIDIPRDLEEAEVEAPDPESIAMLEQKDLRAPTVRTRPNQAVTRQIADLLTAADRPAVIAGSELRWFDASDALVEFAESVDVPVLAAPTVRGIIPESHPLSLGVVGRPGSAPSNEYLQNADLVLGIGSRFSDLTTLNWTLIDDDATLVQTTVREREIDRQYLATVTSNADPKSVLTDLTAELRQRDSLSFADVGASAREAFEQAREDHLDTSESQATEGIDIRNVIKAVKRHAEEYTYTTGGGVHSGFASQLPVEDVNGTFKTDNFAGMSQGLPLAMGAAAAVDRPVFTFEGDGGFAMILGDLETLVREDVPIKVFVLNNNGMMSQAARQRKYYDERFTGTRFSNPDFGAIAREFGMFGDRITEEDEVDDAVKRLLDVDGPGLLDVRIDPWVGTGGYDRD